MSTNVINIDDQQDKRESLERSARAKRNFTIICQDLYQKSGLSLEAMGLISYLMSLPEDWVVYVSHLRKVFNMGKNKILSIMRELIIAGYMQRYQLRDSKGRITGWKTKYSDIPEFLGSRPGLHFPALDNPALDNPELANQSLQSNNSTKKILNKKTTKQSSIPIQPKPKLQKPSHQADPNVVVALVERVKHLSISEKLLLSWVDKYGIEYVIEKVNYTLSAECNNPAGFLNKAIAQNWKQYMPNESKQEKKAVEIHYPSHNENLTWYASLSDKEKNECYQHALSKHAHFGDMLKADGIDFMSTAFLKSTWFNMLMQLLGRAK